MREPYAMREPYSKVRRLAERLVPHMYADEVYQLNALIDAVDQLHHRLQQSDWIVCGEALRILEGRTS